MIHAPRSRLDVRINSRLFVYSQTQN